MIVVDNLAEVPRNRNAQPSVPVGKRCVWRVLVRMVEGQRTSPEQDCLMASFLTPSPLAGSCESLDILALSEMAVSFF